MNTREYRVKFFKLFALFALLVVLILSYDRISIIFDAVISAFVPFIIGLVVALILNMPVRFFETKVFKKKWGKLNKIKRVVSIVISILIFLVVVGGLGYIVAPKIGNALKSITTSVPNLINNIADEAKLHLSPNGRLFSKINEFQNRSGSLEDLTVYFWGFAPKLELASSIYEIVQSITGSVVNIMVAIIFCFYLLLQKEKIFNFLKLAGKTFLKPKNNERVKKIFNMFKKSFENFICGQCLECFLVAVIFTIFSSIFGFKCSLIIGIIMFFLAFVPYLGNIISCGIGAIMTLAVETPGRAIWFVVLFAVIQLLDMYFLYPRVIGLKVEMPPLLIFMTSIIGGSLFGVFGIIFSIPIVTTLYMLIKERIDGNNHRLEKGELNSEKL